MRVKSCPLSQIFQANAEFTSATAAHVTTVLAASLSPGWQMAGISGAENQFHVFELLTY